MTRSPFHAGEQAVQSRLGVRETIEPWARKVVRPFLNDEHRAFYAALPFLVAAGRDADGRPWATAIAAEPGFARSRNPQTLTLSRRPGPGDPLEHTFAAGADIGLLGIDLATRRRNRLNGRIAHSPRRGLTLAVDQSYGNCPQFITERGWRRADRRTPAPPARRHRRLTPSLVDWITSADTCFIASGHRGEGEDPAFGMDASHRGGDPGFVRVEEGRTLVFPDYAGNNHFNTIGNLVLDPRAGLLFVDFATGSLLHLTGRVEIDWDSPELATFPGARRLVRFELDEAIERRETLPLRWESVGGAPRALRVVERNRESDDVVSFVLAANDDQALPRFEAGQHLPIEFEIPGQAARVRRSYSLSGDPGAAHYRITVKRDPQGLGSRHLHDVVTAGDTIHARPPAGAFVLRAGTRPVVLVSAGVGLTPMLGMLHALAAARDPRSVWFVHGARDGAHHPLADEVDRLVAALPEGHRHVAYSRPRAVDRDSRRSDSEGRIDGARIATLIPQLDAEFYLCGPVAFMARIQHDLEQRGVPPGRIHHESFGPIG